jgi:hypothetical protein
VSHQATFAGAESRRRPTLQTVPQQPDNFVPSMTIASMTLAEMEKQRGLPFYTEVRNNA